MFPVSVGRVSMCLHLCVTPPCLYIYILQRPGFSVYVSLCVIVSLHVFISVLRGRVCARPRASVWVNGLGRWCNSFCPPVCHSTWAKGNWSFDVRHTHTRCSSAQVCVWLCVFVNFTRSILVRKKKKKTGRNQAEHNHNLSLFKVPC